MSDSTPRAWHGEDPAEAEAREARHQVLIDLLGAYADRELPPETVSQIDAHLVGCARCRRELQVHTALRWRLEAEPPLAASPAFRDRIGAALAATPVADIPRERRESFGARVAAWRIRLIVGALAILAVAVVLWSVEGSRHPAPPVTVMAAAAVHVPLVDSILADYRRVTAADLPGRARDLDVVRAAVPFTVEVLRVPSLRLLAAWTTSVGGEPAAVLAYRWDDRVVLEYLVSEERFFQHAAIRRGVADGHLLALTAGSRGVLAWPTTAAGAFLVGDVSPRQLAALAAQDALARKAGRGAP